MVLHQSLLSAVTKVICESGSALDQIDNVILGSAHLPTGAETSMACLNRLVSMRPKVRELSHAIRNGGRSPEMVVGMDAHVGLGEGVSELTGLAIFRWGNFRERPERYEDSPAFCAALGLRAANTFEQRDIERRRL